MPRRDGTGPAVCLQGEVEKPGGLIFLNPVFQNRIQANEPAPGKFRYDWDVIRARMQNQPGLEFGQSPAVKAIREL